MPFIRQGKNRESGGGGLVLFHEVHEAIKGEKVLREAGYSVKLVAPPPHMRKGCDLAVEVNLVEQPGIRRILESKDVAFQEITPVNAETSALLDIVKVTDFGQWLMVKAGNMKITFEKATGEIVNTSGGGCPDIPVMHIRLLGSKLAEAPRPKDIGFTLCSLMLDKALEESLNLWKGGQD